MTTPSTLYPLTLLILTVGSPAWANVSWIGRQVILAGKGNLKVRTGNTVVGTLDQTDYSVTAENGEWIELSGHPGGWVLKTEVVPIEHAVAFFTDRIREEPSYAGWYNRRAIAWRHKGEYNIAIRDCDEVIRLDPKEYAYNNRGRAWHDKGDYDRAIADYDEAIRLNPKYAMAYNNRGRAWSYTGDYDRAIADYDETIRLDPKYAVAHNNRAWLRATCPDEKLRDGQKAVEAAKTACELTGFKYPGMLDTYAAALAEAGDFNKAVEWQTKALELAPEKEKLDYRPRLELYRQGKPYRQQRKAPASGDR